MEHDWIIGWQDSEKPHPGFGGSTNIYGGYTNQCSKCGIYIHEVDEEQDCKGIVIKSEEVKL